MSDYNGWTNYETWRVNLEIFDGMDIGKWSDKYELSKWMQEHAENLITDYKTETSLAQDYALAFLSAVNWYEIAQHYETEETEA
jgi:hypothetical protein